MSTAAGRAVNAALKKALATASVQNAVKAELLRQLRVRRPLALVNGYYASPINLASVYQAPGVRAALLASLGTNGPQLINQAAGAGADRLMIAFVPAGLGQNLLPQFNADITRTLGVTALQTHMTDFVVTPVILVFALAGSGTLTLISLAESLAAFLDWLFRPDPVQSAPDCDDTGPNGDCDGDGVKNSEDDYPYDKEKSICDCGRPHAGISLTTTVASDLVPSLVRILNATQGQGAHAVSLGAVLQGRPNTLAVTF